MHIRHCVALGLIAMTPLCASAQSVVELPGVHASAETSCVDPARAASAAISYNCLNRMMAADPVPAAPPDLNADVSKRQTNSLGLYNASGLRNRMGPNLGNSVQPYRPKVSYPNPLATPAR
jgi:hypothetical protein